MRLLLFTLFGLVLPQSVRADDLFAKKAVVKAERLSMVAVWDMPGHASAPDLLRYDNRWLVAFREASAVGAKDGAIRVMSSLDGAKWSTASRLDHAIADLDRPRLHLLPDGHLLMTAAVTMHADSPSKHRTYAWKSWNGRDWEGPQMVGDDGIRLGPIEWKRGKAYAFGYQPGARERELRGYMGEAINADLEMAPASPATLDSAQLGQTGIAFLPDDSAVAVADHVEGSLRFGTSRPPYRHWQWKDLAQKVADPRIVRLDDGRLLVSGADSKGRPALFFLNPAEASLTQLTALGADVTLEGAAVRWHDGALWVAYRAANLNGVASIYLARIKLP
jgi:hypothetical protein